MLVDRLMQLVAIGLVFWSADIALGRGAAPGQLPFYIGVAGFMIVSIPRRVMGATLMVLCGAVEWMAWTLSPAPWALPPPLGSLLAPTALLAILNVVRPTLASNVLAIDNDPNAGHEPAWRMIVFAGPLMLVMLVALFRYK